MHKDLEMSTTDKPISPILKSIVPATYILVFIHFLLNFLGEPALKWFYLVEVLFVLISVLIAPLRYSIIPMIALLFIEGQGRIIWHYHPIARIAFDLTLVLAVLKSMANKKRMLPINLLSTTVFILIALHFLWYILQIFNIYSIGYFGVIAASKIYIFPFFLFFMFLENPLDSKSYFKIQAFTFFILLLEILLSIFQMNFTESSVLNLTDYYYKSLKQDVFTGLNFRPYGTSAAPGAVSIYFFLTLGMLFLAPTKSFIKSILFSILQIGTVFCIFISQVRSSLVKHIVLLCVMSFSLFIVSKVKLKLSVQIFLTISLTLYGLTFLPNYETLFPEIDFASSVSRISIFNEPTDLTSHRASGDRILNSIAEKLLDSPMGLGPGRTGAAATIGAAQIYADPIYGINSSWAWDNLLVSLIIDLGVGAIFYILVITILLIRLTHATFLAYHSKNYTIYRVAAISMLTCYLIIIGNWGALGLTYNPESFIFWFFMAQGLNATRDLSKVVTKN